MHRPHSVLFIVLIFLTWSAAKVRTAAETGAIVLLNESLTDSNQLLRTLVISSLAVIILCLFFIIFILLRYIKTVQKKEVETSHLNLLRQTFIDADERLIYLKDSQLRYVFINKAVEKFYGLPAEAIIGKDDYALTEKEFADLRRDTDEEVTRKNKRVVDQVRWGERIFKTVKFPVEMSDGSTGVGAYIEEVTEDYKAKRRDEKNMRRLSLMAAVFNHPDRDAREQLDYVLNECLKLTESKYGFLYIYNAGKNIFELNSWSRNVMHDCAIPDKQASYQIHEMPNWGAAVHKKKAVIFNDGSGQFDLPSGHVGINRFISVPVISDGEIAAVIGLANKAEDYDNEDISQVNALMKSVWNVRTRNQRSRELEAANARLAAEQDKLKLILDSTAEAVYGIDQQGTCTFCNRRCLELLGYDSADELVGKKLHPMIHHSRRDGSLLPQSECANMKTIRTGEKLQVDDEVLWRRDGSWFEVEYFSYPQYREGEIIGAVVTFMDITEGKKAEEKIEYLSYHDELTGLYNRRFFEAELKRLDTERNLPISIIIGDVNALKLANDIFGHEAGDRLLKAAAESFREVCREDDIIARWGGDEFAILLPGTDFNHAEKICARIREHFSRITIESVEGSISLGAATKETSAQTMQRIMEIAEDEMYTRKTLERSDMACKLVQKIVEKIHKETPEEKAHAENVRDLCRGFARFSNMTAAAAKRLAEAAYLHDIGKVIINSDDRSGPEEEAVEQDIDMRQHPLTGFRILGFCEKTSSFASDIMQHHEHWDGNGYPKGIKGKEISHNARIISLAESYDRMNSAGIPREQSLQMIDREAGKRFDPVLAAKFIDFINSHPE